MKYLSLDEPIHDELHMEHCRNFVSGVTLEIDRFSLIRESILRLCVKLGLEWRI